MPGWNDVGAWGDGKYDASPAAPTQRQPEKSRTMSTASTYSEYGEATPLVGSPSSRYFVGGPNGWWCKYYTLFVFVVLLSNHAIFWSTFSTSSIPAWKVTNPQVNGSAGSAWSYLEAERGDNSVNEDAFGPERLFSNTSGSSGITDYYGYTAANNTVVQQLLNMGAIGGCPAGPVAAWLLSQPRGLRTSIRVAAVLMALGTLLRLVPSWVFLDPETKMIATTPAKANIVYGLLITAQLLNGIAGPFLAGACSLLSATWFSQPRRGTATAVAFAATNLGGLLSAALSPLVLNGSATNTGTLLEIEFGMAVFGLLTVLLYLPGGGGGGDGGPASPAVSDPLKRVGVKQWAKGLYRTVRSPMMLLTFIAGTVIGVKSAWGALLPAELRPAPAALFLMYNCGALLVGCVAGGVLLDYAASRKLKTMLVLSFAVTGLLYTGFALEVPSIFSKKAALPGGSDFAQVAWLTAAGVAQGLSVPAFFELGAEITFAKAASAEAISGSLIVFMWNFSSCVTIGLQSAPGGMGAPIVNMITAGHFLLASLVAWIFLKEQYNRRETEPGGGPTVQDVDPGGRYH